VDFRGEDTPFFEQRLRQYIEPEWNFVTSLNPRIVLRASNGVHYVVVEGGGGAALRADRTGAGPGSWDVVGVSDLTGGPLFSGDRVSLAAADGIHYVQADNGGGGALTATSKGVGAFETFVIEKPGGGTIHDGDPISLRTSNGSYVSAQGGGGSTVSAAGASRGAWETFTLLYVTPHTTEPIRSMSVRPAAAPIGSRIGTATPALGPSFPWKP